MSGTAPAGWYVDGSGALRWWDGTNWTAHLMPPPTVPPAVQPAPVLTSQNGPTVAPAPTITSTLTEEASPARSAYDTVALASWSSPTSRPAVEGAVAVPASLSAQAPSTSFGGVFTPAPTQVALSPSRNAAGEIGGWLMALWGLGMILFGVYWFLGPAHRAYVPTGFLIGGGVLAFRGVLRVRRGRPAVLRIPAGVGLPSRRVLALAGVGLVAVVAFLGVRALSGPGPLTDLPGLAAPSAGTWPAGFTAVAPDGAYRRLESTPLPCSPGFRCSDIEVLTRTDCRLPQAAVVFYDADGRRTQQGVGLGFQNSSPDLPVTVAISTADPAAASYAVTEIACAD